MKRENANQSDVRERTSMKHKSRENESQNSKRPEPSQNTTNPNRGINEDEQKRRTNQDEEDEITNADKQSSGGEGGRTGNESLSDQERKQRDMEKQREGHKR